MKRRIAIAASVLMLGTALAAVPAFPQTPGARTGPKVQQESTGKVPQQESSGCVRFQQGCSDKPYPMAENASPNNEQKSAQTGTRENRQSRSVSSRERVSSTRVSERERTGSERTSSARARVGERERSSGSVRVSERERGGVRVGARARTSDEYLRSAAAEPSGANARVVSRESVRGETFGFGEQPRYYNYAPGVQVAGAPSSTVGWCGTRFHSFDPATGTYVGFDGIRHPCP